MNRNKATLLDRIRDDRIVLMPGVYDGFSLRLVEEAGFEAAIISGAGLAESRLGWPDVGLVGPDLNIAATEALASRSSIPLLADGDTGYGNAVNVHFVVRRFERAGAAGIMLEDQVWPKRCGHFAGKEVIAAEEMALKIRSAVDARDYRNFLIKARTDAASLLGIDEAIRRAQLYVDSGADLIFADAILSLEDIEQFVSAVAAPVAINMGFGIRTRSTTPLISPRVLEEIGVAVVEYPRMLTAAAIRGMQNALAAFGDAVASREAVERPDLLVSFEELNELMGIEAIRALEASYLTEEVLTAKYGRPD